MDLLIMRRHSVGPYRDQPACQPFLAGCLLSRLGLVHDMALRGGYTALVLVCGL